MAQRGVEAAACTGAQLQRTIKPLSPRGCLSPVQLGITQCWPFGRCLINSATGVALCELALVWRAPLCAFWGPRPCPQHGLGTSHLHPVLSEDKATERAEELAGCPQGCCPGPGTVRVVLIICSKFPRRALWTEQPSVVSGWAVRLVNGGKWQPRGGRISPVGVRSHVQSPGGCGAWPSLVVFSAPKHPQELILHPSIHLLGSKYPAPPIRSDREKQNRLAAGLLLLPGLFLASRFG